MCLDLLGEGQDYYMQHYSMLSLSILFIINAFEIFGYFNQHIHLYMVYLDILISIYIYIWCIYFKFVHDSILVYKICYENLLT